MSDQIQALSGIRILDFSQVLAGPFATQQLAQLGADVIKVEQPGTGDMTRGLMSADSDGLAPSFMTCNLGKRSLTLDLKHERAKEVLFKLLPTCDVVVENFKPGTIERLGYGYEAVKAVKPDIIYASISGYGQSGPKAELPAFDGAIQAASGMMSISGHPDTGPVRTGYFAVDMSTALNAAFAITAALFRRHLTGIGQRIDVAMMDTAFMMQAPQLSAYLQNATLPELMGNRSPTKQPTANVFATSDGYVQVAAMKESHVQAVCSMFDREDLYTQHRDPVDRVRAMEVFNQVLIPGFAAETTEHWLTQLTARGVPCAPIRNLQESLADPQNAHRLSITEYEHPLTGDPTKAISSSHVADPAAPRVQRPPPKLGEHNQEILSELGYSAADIEVLTSTGVL